MQVETVREFVEATAKPYTVDREAGVIRGVKIIGEHSKNGRRYPKEVLRRAVTLYEGALVNVNHDKNLNGPRDYRDRIGVMRQVREGEGGLHGDLHYNPKHDLAEQLAWDAEHAPEKVGLSPVHTVRLSRQNGTTVVESVVRVRSIDLVADPATTTTLFESTEHEPESDMSIDLSTLTVEQLRESRSDLIDELLTDKSREAELVELRLKNKTLQEQIEKFTAEKKQAELAEHVDQLLDEHKVPIEARTKMFRKSLLVAEDDAERVELIGEWLDQVGAQRDREQRPRSRERQPESFAAGRRAERHRNDGGEERVTAESIKEFAEAIAS